MNNKKKNIILISGIVFLLLETWKQLYLYFVVFNRHYDVWYFPFQLCSMPIYIPLVYELLDRKQYRRANNVVAAIRNALISFMKNYFLLGGIMALIVRDGFTFTNYPLLTVHGIIWHIGMIGLSVYVFLSGNFDSSNNTKPKNKKSVGAYRGALRGFFAGTIVYMITAVVALTLNILLHRYGNADMYYISPYHISTQPVFGDIDLLIGRIPGIIVYIASTIFGGFLVHIFYYLISKRSS